MLLEYNLQDEDELYLLPTESSSDKQKRAQIIQTVAADLPMCLRMLIDELEKRTTKLVRA